MKFWVNGQYERLEDPSYVEGRRRQMEEGRQAFLRKRQKMIEKGKDGEMTAEDWAEMEYGMTME